MPEPAIPEPPGIVTKRRSIRWWPAAIILLLASGAVFWVRSSYGTQRQDQNLAIAGIGIISILLLLLWCVLFSRLPWKIRFSVLGAVFAIMLLAPALFRIRGVTGDFVPVLEWRWKP